MSRPTLWGTAALLVALAAPAVGQEDQGRTLYMEHCASCHGANLEGQPDWRSPRPDGTWRAPPHSVDGHTWHNADAMLFDYVKRGGQAALDDMGVEFRSAMPGFGDRLTDDEIEAVLAFIASTWPAEIQRVQESRE